MKNTYCVKFVKTHELAQIPAPQRNGDVGYDVSCVEMVRLEPHAVTKVRTGLVFAHLAQEETRDDEFVVRTELDPWKKVRDVVGKPTPCAVFPQVTGRGGLASRGVFPVGGIVDSNFRGELMVLLANINPTPVFLKPGERCAQLVFQKVIAHTDHSEVRFEEVSEIVDVTERGASGFGSSDTKSTL